MADVFEALHGYYIDDLAPGMSAAVSKTFSASDVDDYARLSTDTNPLHLDEAFAVHARTGGRVLHGMITASLISAIIGTRLPGPGCLWMAQDMRFLAPVRIGETVRAVAEVLEVDRDKQQVVMATTCEVAGTMVEGRPGQDLGALAQQGTAGTSTGRPAGRLLGAIFPYVTINSPVLTAHSFRRFKCNPVVLSSLLFCLPSLFARAGPSWKSIPVCGKPP